MQKFENMDVIAALEAIMHQNTAYYQSDFAYDIKMLREAARSDQPEDKLLLWLSRPSGTFCFRERDVLLKDTQAYNTWKFCGEQTHDRILAYAVELTGAANGTVQGNLYELDYQQHFQHIRDAALPVGANRLIYESGMREIGPKEHFDSRPDKYFGEFVRYEMQPRDPELLQAAIRQEQRSRESAQPGDFKEHLAALHTGLIEAEAQRIAADMKRLAAPNSPDKNHFMVEVSPYFTKLASSRDTDQLLAMLPYKSMHLSSVKDRFGIYALVDKKENRDRGMQIISQFTKGDTQMILVGQKSLFANGITFILFGFYTVYSSLFLALGKGAAGFFLGACRQGVCFVPVILLLPMVWGMNGILYAQPIADVISVVITVFMALHLHRELSMAEKQVMSNSEM